MVVTIIYRVLWPPEPMYLDRSTVLKNGKAYTRILLRESFRENGQVKKRTVANLSACSAEEIEAIRLALEHKHDLVRLDSLDNTFTIKQGSSIGAVWLVYELARRLGIAQALGDSRQGKLALWQIIARVIDQGSRLSAVRLAGQHAACEILDLNEFNEDHLYQNLDWLAEHQATIERKLFKRLYGNEKTDLFLYDVTSSYLEGEHNEFAAFGYNRDRKRGKRQLVIGLLCDREGVPVSIEVFPGNTQDTKTFAPQVKKVADRFGGGAITFVGDRGMIKGPQIDELNAYKEHDFHYITAITKAQIEKLLNENIFQMDLFDQVLGEVRTADDLRYVLRRNPARAEEIQRTRTSKYQTLVETVSQRNTYLQNHPRATIGVARCTIEAKAKRLKIDDWINLSCQGRTFTVSKDTDRLQELEKLDGCYVLKTDLPEKAAPKETIHGRYKDLALVEWAFRTCKTAQLEMRPIHVRLASRTRGHAFVVMMAYKLVKALTSHWQSLEITVEEGLDELNALCVNEVTIKGRGSYSRIPDPRALSQKLLDAAKIKLPPVFPSKGVNVATKRKLVTRRKAA